METHVTYHSLERLKKRVGMNKKRAERQVELAYTRGKRACDCKRSRDRAYLQRKNKVGQFAVAYNGCCWIFSEETKVCITVYELPKSFDKKVVKPDCENLKQLILAYE